MKRDVALLCHVVISRTRSPLFLFLKNLTNCVSFGLRLGFVPQFLQCQLDAHTRIKRNFTDSIQFWTVQSWAYIGKLGITYSYRGVKEFHTLWGFRNEEVVCRWWWCCVSCYFPPMNKYVVEVARAMPSQPRLSLSFSFSLSVCNKSRESAKPGRSVAVRLAPSADALRLYASIQKEKGSW